MIFRTEEKDKFHVEEPKFKKKEVFISIYCGFSWFVHDLTMLLYIGELDFFLFN